MAPTSAEQGPRADSDWVSIGDLLRIAWDHRLLIGAATLLGGLLLAIVSFLLAPTYRALTSVMPSARDSGSGALMGMASQLGDFASLAGLRLVSSGGQREEALAILRSRLLADSFFEGNNLLPVLFSEAWDAERKAWRDADPNAIPTLWDAYSLFDSEIRSIQDDRKTGLVTVIIDWRDPVQAAHWANDLVTRANVLLRQRAVDNSARNIRYLEDQLGKTGSIELRQALYRLLEAEYKNVMLAQGTEEYAFHVIDPAVVPRRRHRPQRMLMTVLGAAGGCLLSLLIALLRSSRGASQSRLGPAASTGSPAP